MLQVPYKDYAGNSLFEGDTIRHPNGDEGKIVYYPEHSGHAQWKVDYGDEQLTLCLQIGEKGQAVKVIIS